MGWVRLSAACVFVGTLPLKKVICSSSSTNEQGTWSYFAFTTGKGYNEGGGWSEGAVGCHQWKPVVPRCKSQGSREVLEYCKDTSAHLLQTTRVPVPQGRAASLPPCVTRRASQEPHRHICRQTYLINLSTAMHPALITHFRCVQQGCLLQEELLCPQSFTEHITTPLFYCTCLVSLFL